MLTQTFSLALKRFRVDNFLVLQAKDELFGKNLMQYLLFCHFYVIVNIIKPSFLSISLYLFFITI